MKIRVLQWISTDRRETRLRPDNRINIRRHDVRTGVVGLQRGNQIRRRMIQIKWMNRIKPPDERRRVVDLFRRHALL